MSNHAEGGCGVAFDVELAAQVTQLGAGDTAGYAPPAFCVRAPPPLSPETTPVALCWQLAGCFGKERGLPPEVHRELKVKLMHWPKIVSLFFMSAVKRKKKRLLLLQLT